MILLYVREKSENNLFVCSSRKKWKCSERCIRHWPHDVNKLSEQTDSLMVLYIDILVAIIA